MAITKLEIILLKKNMSIRLKILFGFLILIILLVIAVTISIFQITQMGKSVKTVLQNNYSSIEATRIMLQALKRQDYALVIYLKGNKTQAIDSLNQSHLTFINGLQLARAHISEPGESKVILAIDSLYNSIYTKSLYSCQILEKSGNLHFYFDSVENKIISLKDYIYQLSAINNTKIYQIGGQVTKKSQKAVMPGLITIISALIFAFMFNFFINQFIVKPLIKITEGVDHFVKFGSKFNINIETKDELMVLATSIQNLFISHSLSSKNK